MQRTDTFEIDFDRDNTWDHVASDITEWVEGVRIEYGISSADQRVSAPARLMFQVRNNDGEWWPENTASRFYGLLRKNLLIRWVIDSPQGAKTFTGRIERLPIMPNPYAPQRVVQIMATDFNQDLRRAPYRAALQENVRTDQELLNIFAQAPIHYPYAGQSWVLGYSTLEENTRIPDHTAYTNFEQGQTTIPFTGDVLSYEFDADIFGMGAWTAIEMVVQAEMGGWFWWDITANEFRFYDRQYLLRNGDEDFTIEAQDLLSTTQPATTVENLVNIVQVSYSQREVGDPGSVLWSNGEVFSLEPGDERTFEIFYRDPDLASVQVAGKDMITPVAGVDFAGNSAEDGTGVDQTSLLTVSASFSGTTAKITIGFVSGIYRAAEQGEDIYDWKTEGGAALTCYVTTLQVRGTPLRVYQPEIIEERDANSIGENGQAYGRNHIVQMVGTRSLIRGYAKTLLRRTSRFYQYANFASITQIAATERQLGQILVYGVGDRVRLNLSGDDWTEHDRDYMIMHESHVYQAANRQHTVTRRLYPILAEAGWRLGVAGASELEQSTILNF